MNGQSSAKQDTSRYLWIILLILVGQAFLLAFRLADQSMWTDEMHTARIVRSPSLKEALAQIQLTENRPPLHYLALWGWARIIGPSEWGMRSFSIAAILLATAATFRLACDFTSPRAALWTALLSATAPTLLWHGRIIRGYAVAVPLASLSALTFWRAWRSPRFCPKLVYLLVSSMLLFTDYLVIPVVGAHVLYLGSAWLFCFRRRSSLLFPARSTRQRGIWGWLMVGVGLLIVVGGLGLTLRWQSSSTVISGGVSNLIPSLPSKLIHLPRQVPTMIAASIFVLYSFSVGEAIFPWHPLAIPGTLAALTLGWLGLRQMWRDRRDAAFIIILLITVPLAFTSLIVFGMLLGLSMLVIAAARSLYLGPLLFIPLGAGLEARHSRRFALLLLTVLLAARSITLLNQTVSRHFLNPVHEVRVRELAVQVARNVRPGDAVIFEERLPFDIYFRQLDATTPLFTPGPQHMGHALGAEVPPGSPAFLSQGEPFIPSIDPERLLDYLRESQPPRLWLVVFHHEWTERTIEHEIGQPLVQAQLYQLVSRVGYAPQDPLYARLRAWWRPRTPIQYKAEILLYIRADSRGKSLQPIR